MRTCEEEGCPKPHRARGLCTMHWKRKYGIRAKVIVPCTACEEPIQKHKGDFIKRRPVCSNLCKYFTTHGKWPMSEIPKRHPVRWTPRQKSDPFVSEKRTCAWCATEFIARRRAANYCTRECKAKAGRSRRRALEHNAPGSYTWAEVIGVFLALGRCCAYCGMEIPGQPEPDHVIPLSKGGSNSITNILPACQACNGDKRDLLLHEWAEDRKRRGLDTVRTTWVRGDLRYQHLAIVQEHERAA